MGRHTLPNGAHMGLFWVRFTRKTAVFRPKQRQNGRFCGFNGANNAPGPRPAPALRSPVLATVKGCPRVRLRLALRAPLRVPLTAAPLRSRGPRGHRPGATPGGLRATGSGVKVRPAGAPGPPVTLPACTSRTPRARNTCAHRDTRASEDRPETRPPWPTTVNDGGLRSTTETASQSRT